MKIFLFVAGLVFSSLAFAAPDASHGEFCNSHGTITEFVCDGGYASGPGWWYDPQDGCYYRDTGKYCHNNNPPNPPYPPPPPPPPQQPPPYNGGWTRVRCESWGYQRNECYLGYGVYRVTVERSYGQGACIPYQTFGAYPDRMWVSNGCSGIFFVEYNRR